MAAPDERADPEGRTPLADTVFDFDRNQVAILEAYTQRDLLYVADKAEKFEKFVDAPEKNPNFAAYLDQHYGDHGPETLYLVGNLTWNVYRKIQGIDINFFSNLEARNPTFIGPLEQNIEHTPTGLAGVATASIELGERKPGIVIFPDFFRLTSYFDELGAIAHELSHLPRMMPKPLPSYKTTVNASPFAALDPNYAKAIAKKNGTVTYEPGYTFDTPISNDGCFSKSSDGSSMAIYKLEQRRKLFSLGDLPYHAATFQDFITGNPGAFSDGFPIDQLGYGRPKKTPGQ
jgi:hypothetical protein